MRTFVILAGLTAGTALLSTIGLGQTPAANSQKNSSKTQNSTSSQNTSKTQNNKPRSTSPMKSARAKNSSAASDLLAATNQALDATQRQDKTDALFHVNHALENAGKVTTVEGSKLVPIYEELSEYSVLEPIMQAKNNAKNTDSKTGKSSADRSTQSKNSASINNGATVEQVTTEFTNVSLDVSQAKQHLEAAKSALNSGNFDAAETDLAAVGEGLITETVAADRPLLRARRNLIIARDQEMVGNAQGAQAAFKEMSQALTDYGNSSSSHAQDAKKLKTEVDTYAQSLKPDTTGVDTKVEGWWDQITGWIAPSTASNTSNKTK